MGVLDVVFSSKTVEWATPLPLFEEWDRRFAFTLDVCATSENHKCAKFFTKEQDGLLQDWSKDRCWMNPPYGKEIGLWCKKAWDESCKGALVVGLLPVRPDTRWWKTYVESKTDIRFIQGRLRFGDAKYGAPFPSAIAIWYGWAPLTGHFGQGE